jgi:hypothetical protein
MSLNEDEARRLLSPSKKIPPLDFNEMQAFGDVHQLLKKKFGLRTITAKTGMRCGLPPLPFEDDEQILVKIYGFSSMPKEWQRECMKMLRWFDDVHRANAQRGFRADLLVRRARMTSLWTS